jgi:hypothetical protein
VDPQVQGALVLRTIAYGCCLLISVAAMLIFWRMAFAGPARPPQSHLDDLWFQYGPAVIAAALLMPLVIFDIVRLTNRFAGPMYRLRRALHQLAKGEMVPPMSFREGDFWREVATDFNAVVARLQAARAPYDHECEDDLEPMRLGK